MTRFTFFLLIPILEKCEDEIILWLCEINYPSSSHLRSTMLGRIIRQGSPLKLVKILVENEYPFSWDTMSAAIQCGQLETVKWLRERGCPWDEWTFDHAWFRGDLSIIKYMIQNECPFDSPYIETAMHHGHEHVVTWLREEGNQ